MLSAETGRYACHVLQFARACFRPESELSWRVLEDHVDKYLQKDIRTASAFTDSQFDCQATYRVGTVLSECP